MATGQLYQRLMLKGRIRQIQMVAVVARCGSMQQAARDLAISQPAITKAVAELEAELGLALFERHARGIRLTRFGRQVLPQLERILTATEQFSEAVQHHHSLGASVLRVASVAAGISGLLARMVAPFCTAHPDILLKVDEVDGPAILSLAAREEYDLFICRNPDTLPEGWQFLPLQEDDHAIIAAPDHPLVGRRDVTLGDLHAQTWQHPPAGIPADAILARLFEGLPPPRMAGIATRSRTLNRAIITDMGLLSLAPVSIFRAEILAGTLACVSYPLEGALRPLGVMRQVRSPGAAVDRFVAALRKASTRRDHPE
jgi:DNA-binding transcriptional LysR family regulator